MKTKKGENQERVLARVLAEDLKQVLGGDLDKVETKSISCGTNCDEIVKDSWKLVEDSANE